MPGLINDQEYAAQFQAGRGVSTRWGPKPPTPDEVAPRGTPAWREAWRAQDAWQQNQLRGGATAWDLGLRDAKSLGKHFFTRIREGQLDPRARGNWIAAANSGPNYFARGFYNPNDTNFYEYPGGRRTADASAHAQEKYGFGGSASAAPTSSGPSVPGPSGSVGGGTGVAPQADVYLQDPRKPRKLNLRNILGGARG